MSDTTEDRPLWLRGKRLVRDLQFGDVVASSDDTRVWTVIDARVTDRGGLWRVTMTSPGREQWVHDYHPDEEAPAPTAGSIPAGNA